MEVCETKRKSSYMQVIYIVMLILYPLRHVSKGVDLWDAGYNYTNLQYSGLEFMDSMWFFAIWLSNAIGNLFSKLPFGDSYMGMNIYTGLIISLMAVVAFLFCTCKLKMPGWMAFIAEILACSLCWAPTAVLYSYFTYAFFLGGTILLYQGLVSDKPGYLIGAGIVLGLNVGNRFSNLVHMGLILAVWIYGIIDKKKVIRVVQQTGYCISGYVAGLGTFLAFISLKYGFSNYLNGVLRLFQMTEQAEEYAPAHMLLGMILPYFDSSYFLKRFIVAIACGVMVCIVLRNRWQLIRKISIVLITLLLGFWLAKNNYYYRDYASYYAIYYPCIMTFMMVLGLSAYRLLDRDAKKEEKLQALILILTVLINTLGGNNTIYANINNMFLVLPVFVFHVWKLCREKRGSFFYPFKAILVMTIFFFAIQGIQFGNGFVYEEATGGKNIDTVIRGIPRLEGMQTNAVKAESLQELYNYIQNKGIQDKECIVYGNIPGVAYCMELTPAMNVWSDLRSYMYQVMEQDLGEITGRPVIILSAGCDEYVLDREKSDIFIEAYTEDKMKLICTYIEENGYTRTFRNDKFAVYE